MPIPANDKIRWKERIATVALGHSFKEAEEFWFDWVLYPYVIAVHGSLLGGLAMMALSALSSYSYIILYDWSRTDWLGLELLKQIREGNEPKSWWRKVIRKAQQGRLGNTVVFLILSIRKDPFVTTAYLRRGSGLYNGMSQRDWKIFFASVAVGNLVWTGFVSATVEAFRGLWQILG